MFPIEVPIAKNLEPVEEMQVGTPTPLVAELAMSNT